MQFKVKSNYWNRGFHKVRGGHPGQMTSLSMLWKIPRIWLLTNLSRKPKVWRSRPRTALRPSNLGVRAQVCLTSPNNYLCLIRIESFIHPVASDITKPQLINARPQRALKEMLIHLIYIKTVFWKKDKINVKLLQTLQKRPWLNLTPSFSRWFLQSNFKSIMKSRKKS